MLPFSMSFVDDLETLEGIQIHPAVKCHPRVLKKGAKNIIPSTMGEYHKISKII